MTERAAVITGATGGLGKQTAAALAAQGWSLALLSRNQAELDSLARDLNLPSERLYARTLDLLDAPTLRATAEAVAAKFGAVHALIHLVGGWIGGKTVLETSADDLSFMLNQHVMTTFHALQAFVPHLVAGRHGRVIIISSPVATIPAAKLSAYAAAKSAQDALILTLAEELRDQGVTANIIPTQAIDEKGTGKGTSPAEIVKTLLFLCSDESARVTGARIPVI
jgi:NAD(P)-dependent dehydrogenase (short-subunit alcohol dehydrogenase family)